jgi:hypothetical protein
MPAERRVLDARFRHFLKIERGRAGLYVAANQFQNLTNHPARAAHLLDLLRRLQYHRH